MHESYLSYHSTKYASVRVRKNYLLPPSSNISTVAYLKQWSVEQNCWYLGRFEIRLLSSVMFFLTMFLDKLFNDF